MPAPHLIERLEFEIGFADEATAWAHAQRVQRFAVGPATAVIEAVFDELAGGEAVHQWATLALDLGVLGVDATDESWAEQLREALRTTLRSAADGPSGPVAAGATVCTREQVDLDRMQWWLQHGHLPWQAGPGDPHGDAVDQLAEQLLDEQTPALMQTLLHGSEPAQGDGAEQQPDHPLAHALERVALQWPLPLLERLAKAMALPAPGTTALAGPSIATEREGAADVRHRWLREMLVAVGAGRSLDSNGLGGEPAAAETPEAEFLAVSDSWVGTPAVEQRQRVSDASGTHMEDAAHTATAPAVASSAESDHVLRSSPDGEPERPWRQGTIEPGCAAGVGPLPAPEPDPSDNMAPGALPGQAVRTTTDGVDRALARPPGRAALSDPAVAWVDHGADGASPGVAGLRRLALSVPTWQTILAPWSVPDRMALVAALAPPADAGPLAALAEAASRHVGAVGLDAPSAAADPWACLLHRLAGPSAQLPGTRAAWLDDLASHRLAEGATEPAALRQALSAAWALQEGLSTPAATAQTTAPIEAAGVGETGRTPVPARTAEGPEAPARSGALAHRTTIETRPDATKASPDASRTATAGRSMNLTSPGGHGDATAEPAAEPAVGRLRNVADRPLAAAPRTPLPGDPRPAHAAETLLAASRCLHLLALACARAGLVGDAGVLRRADAALLAQAVATSGRGGKFDLAGLVRRWLDAHQNSLGLPSAALTDTHGMREAAPLVRWPQRVARALRAADTTRPGPSAQQSDSVAGPALPVAAAAAGARDTADPRPSEPGKPDRSPHEATARLQGDAPATPAPPAVGGPSGGAQPGATPTGRPSAPEHGEPPGPHGSAAVIASPTGPGDSRGAAPASAEPAPGASPAAREAGSIAAPRTTDREPPGTTASAGRVQTGSTPPAARVGAPSNGDVQAATSDGRESPPGIRSTTTVTADANGDAAQNPTEPLRHGSAHEAAPRPADGVPASTAGIRSPALPVPEPYGARAAVPADANAAPAGATPTVAWHNAPEVFGADVALLSRRLAVLIDATTAEPPTPAAPRPPAPAARAPGGGTHDETIYIGNAGLVLAGPYLPRLLTRLGLLVDDRFANEAAARRAVQVLQVVVDGRPETPEHRLALNKLLCGVPQATPVAREIELTAAEQHAITSLLEALIGHWTALGRTSVQGLRESFLQREGALRRNDEGWRLLVMSRPFDMLLDRLPWGFRTCRFPWMDQVLHVDWR